MKPYISIALACAVSTPALAQDQLVQSQQAQDHSAHQHSTSQPKPSYKAQPLEEHNTSASNLSAHSADGHAHHHNTAPTSPSPEQEEHTGHSAEPITHSMPHAMGHATAEQMYSTSSGTSRLPLADASTGGLHLTSGDWMFMGHGYVSTQYTDHSGPRGDDKTYSVSMAMLMAERETSFGKIQLRSMLSLDPTMSNRGYPNLFATGETANGIPLVDRQHPHDFFMELAARVDFNIGDGTTAFLYGGPVGEPAIGPSAFMMRRSSRYNPEAPIVHHWFDSTHITYGVVTAGISASKWQLETSAFRGSEPDEQRWNIETPKLDSWSVRGTLTPTPEWTVQASYAQIKQPEAMHPKQDEDRFTASAHYTNRHGFSAMAAFSSKNRQPGTTLTAWLAEANWDLDKANSVFARVENVSNDELFPDHHDIRHDTPFRISKFQAGYARRIQLNPFELALGGSINTYAKPAALDAVYGNNPWGYTIFARLSLGS